MRKGVSPVAVHLPELTKALLAVPKEVIITVVIALFLILCNLSHSISNAVQAICKYSSQNKRNRQKFILDFILLFKDIDAYKEIKLKENSQAENCTDPPMFSNLTVLPRPKQPEKDKSNGSKISK